MDYGEDNYYIDEYDDDIDEYADDIDEYAEHIDENTKENDDVIDVIDEDIIYDNFTLYIESLRIRWSIPGPLSGDLVAGLALAVDILYKDSVINYEHIDNGRKLIALSPEGYQDYDITFHNLDFALSNYHFIARSKQRIAEDLVLASKTTGYLKWPNTKGYFKWWILDPEVGSYYLHAFRTLEFIQGFISMCNAFNVSFQDYVVELPFKTIETPQGKRITAYEIVGYDIDLGSFQEFIRQAREKYNYL